MKNYIGFVNDHSGSMDHLANAAIQDYNTNITAVKDAASREMLDTVVSVVGLGYPNGRQVTRQVQISNPHVLKPISNWATHGGTPLLDGIGDMIELLESLPDANNPDVSFLIMTTTDGEEMDSRKYTWTTLRAKIAQKQATGRWTFVFRVPASGRSRMEQLGVPLDNIQSWDTTAKGLEASTKITTQAMDGYFAARSAGKSSSNVFYTSTATVDTSKLAAVDKSLYSLYIVEDYFDGAQIKDFILSKRSEYMIGGAFYQLTKTEARVSPTKLILIRDRASGNVYQGADARKMLGIDTVNNARIHPNHGGGGYDIFIQSESVNRKLVKGTGVLYMPSIGRKMTQADLERYASQKPVAPVVTALPDAPATGKPTIAKKPTQVAVAKAPAPQVAVGLFYPTREIARMAARAQGKRQYDNGPTAPKGQRFYVA